jgi:hypothetical protein
MGELIFFLPFIILGLVGMPWGLATHTPPPETPAIIEQVEDLPAPSLDDRWTVADARPLTTPGGEAGLPPRPAGGQAALTARG